MSVTTLSRQGAGVYRLSGLGVGLVSALLCVGGIAPTPPIPPTPPAPSPIVPVVPVAPTPVTVPSTVSVGGGGGWGQSWSFEESSFERRGHGALLAPVGRMSAHGVVERPVVAAATAPPARVAVVHVARLASVASLAHAEASGYIFNLAHHNAAARRVLDEDEDEDARLEDV